MENGCAGTGVTLPIFARGTWMKTYVKVNGRWAYLYLGPSTAGAALSIFISPVVTAKLHTGFLGKILNNVKKWQIPRFINTDKAPAYGRALALLKREGLCSV